MSQHIGIDLPKQRDCAFCAYLRGDRPYTVWRRFELSSVLVTREQRGISHVLVIPNRHVPSLLDLHDDEAHEIIDVVRMSASAIDAVDKRPGISVWQNNGKAASQSIGHLHFHVAGTVASGGTKWGEVRELSIAETDRIARHLDGNDLDE